MGDMLSMKVSGNWAAGLDKLTGDNLAGIIRGGGNAMSEVFQQEAQARVRVKTGTLRNSIYRAYSERRSTPTHAVYEVSWNPRKAPHGHLIENGHWLVRGGKLKKGGKRVRWIPAQPFVRPAYEARKQAAARAAIERMRVKFSELVK